MDLTKEVYTTVNRYFTKLSQVGYVPDSEINKILILFIIDDIISRFTLTENEFRQINGALTCLFGTSCLIPYPDYIIEHKVLNKQPKRILQLKITETNTFRSGELNSLRELE